MPTDDGLEGRDQEWAASAAVDRLAKGEPATDADDAFFDWQHLQFNLEHKAAEAAILLMKTPWWGSLREQLTRLARPDEQSPTIEFDVLVLLSLDGSDRSTLLYDQPVAEYGTMGRRYLEQQATTAVDSSTRRLAAAAQFLRQYAEFNQLTEGIFNEQGPAPRAVSASNFARSMLLCERLGGLGEAFDPERGGSDPASGENWDKLRTALREKAGKATNASVENVDRIRKPCLERAVAIRRAHPDWGNGAVAQIIWEWLSQGYGPGLQRIGKRGPPSAERIHGWIKEAVRSKKLPASTKNPMFRNS